MSIAQPTYSQDIPWFKRGRNLLFVAASTILLIPCFWHSHIEAGDLASHTYNSWLAQLIAQAKAPGLYAVAQWTNVLFDFLLLTLIKMFGFSLGPKLAVAICVLIFFWGVFSFIAVASGRLPWSLMPLLAMLAYGYTFNMGFFNYYLSIGLACLALTFFLHGGQRSWFAGAVFFAVATFAHPLGPVWCLGALLYISLRRALPNLWGFLLPLAVIAIFAVFHWYLNHSSIFEVGWVDKPHYFFNGTDQFVVYSARGRWVATACIIIIGSWLAHESLEWRQYVSRGKQFFLFVELYVVSFGVLCLIPQDFRTSTHSSWVGLLVTRLSLVAAIFVFCALGFMQPRRWITAALAANAALFFGFLYQDTSAINKLEQSAERITAQLPFGTLVIPTVSTTYDSRISFVGHVVDRACIQHCFTYSNYEPSSRQFRVRSSPGSPLATASINESQSMEGGDYVVQPSDPPFINIYRCNPDDFTSLCMRPLHAGNKTGPPEDDDPDQ